VDGSGNFNLFDDSFRRRLSSTVTAAGSNIFRSLQTSNDKCLCRVGQEPTLDQGPTVDEFAGELTIEINSLVKEGKLIAVNSTVDDVFEGHQVQCQGRPEDFDVVVFTNLGINPSELTDEQRTYLQDKFRESYNELSFATCDRAFRTVKEVTLVLGSDVPAQLQNADAVTTFRVKGRCWVRELYGTDDNYWCIFVAHSFYPLYRR